MKPLRVLIVEDCASDAELIVAEIRRAGFDPQWERVDTEADYVSRLRPDLEVILSDFVMPAFSGMRALQLLREKGPTIPFIIVSGSIGEDTAVEAMRKGAADYLLKDRLARLGSAIEHALEQEHLRREREQAEAALRDSERTARAVVDALTAHIAIVDENGCILAVNARWREFANKSGVPLMGVCEGVNYLAVCDAANPLENPEAAMIATGIRNVLAGVGAEFAADYACHSPTEERWFTMRVTPFPGEGPRRAVISHENITERIRLEREVLEVGAQEQRRIGQDLHDDVCQWIAGAEFLTASLAKDLSRRSRALAARALEIGGSMRQALTRTRMIAHGLAPAEIEVNGLGSALSKLAANAEQLFQIRSLYEGPPTVEIRDRIAAIHIYRIAQEAVSNAVRHGRASEVNIRVQAMDGRFSMRICDNGCGIGPSRPQTSSGMGLRTMRYRAEIIGAALGINPGANGGTEVTCTLSHARRLIGDAGTGN